jgi:hypothetical protein
VRNAEIEFLQKEFFKDSSRFPAEITAFYKKGLSGQEKIFDGNLSDLNKKRDEMKNQLDEINRQRLEYAAKLKKSNTDLDSKEEALKLKVAELESGTEKYNRTIDELNTGFGFIVNFFRMKKIENEKEEILKKRNELADQIELIRKKWLDVEKSISDNDIKIQEKWNYLQTEFSIICEKIKNLEENKDDIVRKGAFSEALAFLQGSEKYLTARSGVKAPEKCGKCASKNSENLFFCNFCGEPFSENRGDIDGSLIETGELNRIFTAVGSGVKESVSIIALMRGLRGGVQTFTKSIKNVKKTEDTYSQLSKLKIDIPGFSEQFSGKIADLDKWIDVKVYNFLPLEFAEKIKTETDKNLSGENIEKFFKMMGDELNKRTKEQW